MLLETSEAAQALNVDEKTVVRWIKKDNLPAESIQGNYQINPVDLLEWATEHGIKVNPALYKMPDADNRPLPTLSQALQAGNLSAAQQAYTTLQQDLEKFARGNGPSTQGGSAQPAANVSVQA